MFVIDDDAIRLKINIVPRPQARPRAQGYADAGGRPRARVYKGKEAKAAELEFFAALMESPARPSEPLTGPLNVFIEATLPRPKRVKYGHPAKKPDLDNFVKFALDGLTRAGYWADDKQVVKMWASKTYEDQFNPVGWVINIQPAEVVIREPQFSFPFSARMSDEPPA
jgi:Holliday junction resolvase RusA-like endonuclease